MVTSRLLAALEHATHEGEEVLENLGALSTMRRSYKVVTVADDGTILSMKDRPRLDAAE